MPFQNTSGETAPEEGPVQDNLEETGSTQASDQGMSVHNAFDGSEARWLGALADWRSLTATDLPIGGEAAEDASLKAERTAAADFALALSPDFMTLARKLWLIEMEAYEVAHHGASAKELPIWLAAFRVDLMRLLSKTSD